jgi:hypothetical protein
MRGRDLLGCAQTGTGKTAAFALPILHRLTQGPRSPHDRARPARALVLAPTRELALQIDESFHAYGCHTGLRHAVIFGGVGQNPQTRALRQAIERLIRRSLPFEDARETAGAPRDPRRPRGSGRSSAPGAGKTPDVKRAVRGRSGAVRRTKAGRGPRARTVRRAL